MPKTEIDLGYEVEREIIKEYFDILTHPETLDFPGKCKSLTREESIVLRKKYGISRTYLNILIESVSE